MFKVLYVDDNVLADDLHEALADAGCVDVETVTLDAALVRAPGEMLPDLALVQLAGTDLPKLHRLSRAARDLPIVAICEEQHIDAAFLAGAAECVTTPVRSRELVGRVRSTLRERRESRTRAYRDRRLSETIVELKREKEALERLVCVDALTGIANRRHALSLLESEWRRSGREHHPIGLVMIDLDCYHQYNEQYGHLGGDRCLQLVAEAMVSCLRRPSDYLGRYGGEEFIAVLPNTDAIGAQIVAERLRAAVEALAIPHCASMCSKVVTITAGFASLRVTNDLKMDRLIAAADGALLRAKAQGRNRVEGDAPLVRPSRRVSAQRWERFAPVYADPWFADRIPTYLSEVHAGSLAILHALRTDDSWQLDRTISSLRSTAHHIGLTVIERLIGELERAAAASDLGAAREAIEELVQYVTHVQVVYRRATEIPTLAAAIAT